MRIFFIVVMGALFADFIASSLKRGSRLANRPLEKEIGMTADEYDAKWIEEHPKSWLPLLPFFWLLLAVLGFLWAVFGSLPTLARPRSLLQDRRLFAACYRLA